MATRKFSSGNRLLERFKSYDERFEAVKTTRTIKFIWKGTKRFYANDGYGMRELGTITRIKSLAKKSKLFNYFNQNDITHKLYKLRDNIQYNYLYRRTMFQMIKHSEKNVYCFDINNAYTTISHLFGLIDEKQYKKLIQLKAFYKEFKPNRNINALLGASLIGSRISEDYQGRVILKRTLIENELECLWWLISAFIDITCRDVCKSLYDYGGDIRFVSLGYYVDGIFLNASRIDRNVLKEDFETQFLISAERAVTILSEKLGVDLTQFITHSHLDYKERFGTIYQVDLSKNYFRLQMEDGELKPYAFNTRNSDRQFD